MTRKEENLIPLNRRSEEEKKAIARQGGKASGEVRRQKASMKDIANHFLFIPKRKGKKLEFNQIKNLEEIDNPNLNIDLKTLIVLQQLKRASEGDLKSAEWIQNLIGEGFDQLEEIEASDTTKDYYNSLVEALNSRAEQIENAYIIEDQKKEGK